MTDAHVTHHHVSARSCFWSSQIVNIGSMVSVLLPLPLMILWFFGSMVAYTFVAHHPDPRVREYTRIAGYRFYGYAGTLPVVLIFSSQFHEWTGSALTTWLWVWALGLVVLIPWGIHDLIKARGEDWQDIVVEVKTDAAH